MSNKKIYTILFNVLAISIIVVVFVTFVFAPSKKIIIEKTEDEFNSLMKNQITIIDNEISRFIEGAKSITSRTMIRNKIVEYKEGLISLDELKLYTQKKYNDGVNALENCRYAVRYVDTNIIAEFGAADNFDLQTAMNDTVKNDLSTGLFYNYKDSILFFYVISPIKSNNKIIGYDIMFFSNPQICEKFHTDNFNLNLIYFKNNQYVSLKEDENIIINDTAFYSGNKCFFIQKSNIANLYYSFSTYSEKLNANLGVFKRTQYFNFSIIILLIIIVIAVLQRRAKYIFFNENKILKDKVNEHNEELRETIAELTTAKDIIEKSKIKYEIVANYTYDWEYWIDPNGNFIYNSPSCKRITGYTAQDFFEDKSLLEKIIHPDDIDDYKKHKHEIDENGDRIPTEYRIITKSGKIEWIGHVCLEIIDENGKSKGIRSNNRLITKNKEIYNDLKISEERLKIAQKTANIGHWELDVVNNKLYWSDQVYRIFNLKPQQFSATYEAFLSYIHPEDRKFVSDAYENSLKNKTDYNIIHRLLVNDKVKYVNEKCFTDFDLNGKPLKSVGTVAEITEIIEKENLIKKQNIQLQALNSTKDKLFSIIAHDLRSPFNSIIGFSELICEDQNCISPENSKKFVHLINITAKSTLQLLENLLSWAKSQTGQIKFNPKKLIFKDSIRLVLDVLKVSAKIKNIIIKESFNSNTEIFADDFMLHTILRNLISNAIKYTNENGEIQIQVNNFDNFSEISIVDNGVGMDASIIDNLFTFESKKIKLGTNDEKGSGLGLIVCKEFVEKHGGKIKVKSQINKGSTFSFSLPKK